MGNANVKLNQVERKILESVDPKVRAVVLQSIVQSKTESLERVRKVREEFSIKLGELGNLVMTGFGNKYPVSLYRGQIETLKARLEEIEAFIAANEAEIATREANQDEIRKLRKQAKKA